MQHLSTLETGTTVLVAHHAIATVNYTVQQRCRPMQLRVHAAVVRAFRIDEEAAADASIQETFRCGFKAGRRS